MPRLQKLIEKYKDRKDIVFLSLNMDDNPGMIDPFMAEHKLTLTVLLAYNYVNDTLRVDAIPQSWIVGPDGVIRLKGKGYDPTEKWEQGMRDAIEKVGSSGANPPAPPAAGPTTPLGSL